MSRALYTLALAVFVAMLVLTRAVNGDTRPPEDPAPLSVPATGKPVHHAVAAATVQRLRHRLAAEHRRYMTVRHRVQVLTHVLAHDGTTVEAINLACATYGSCSLLWRRADCETGGTFSPRSYNASGASGLFQFLPSTWRTTPYSAFSVWSAYANAMAAGWMQAHGRGGEWVCQ